MVAIVKFIYFIIIFLSLILGAMNIGSKSFSNFLINFICDILSHFSKNILLIFSLQVLLNVTKIFNVHMICAQIP